MGPGGRMAAARLSGLIGLLALAAAASSHAGLADVLQVEIRPSTRPHHYDIAVTVAHADSGWDHYANRWEVLAPDGDVLATRVLAHPHVHEQPFTRSLSGVKVDPSHERVFVEAHDKVHGWSKDRLEIDFANPVASRYEIKGRKP